MDSDLGVFYTYGLPIHTHIQIVSCFVYLFCLLYEICKIHKIHKINFIFRFGKRRIVWDSVGCVCTALDELNTGIPQIIICVLVFCYVWSVP